jgi:hypothetical protein
MSGNGSDFLLAIKSEQGDRQRAADDFAAAVASGDVDAFDDAVAVLGVTVDAWGLALRRASKVSDISPDIQSAFLEVWVQHKGLGRSTHDRGVLRDALKKLMPPLASPPTAPVQLYRGATIRERVMRRYGFSWSTDKNIARGFAARVPRDKVPASEGVLLSVIAEPAAILYARSPAGWYDEGEFIVDPFELRGVKLIEREIWKE